MTESTPPGALGAEPSSAPDTDGRALAFADADSAKQWARTLPLTNIALVCETVQGQLKVPWMPPTF